MSRPRLAAEDWQEIFYALDLKVQEIEEGKYDEVPGEVDRHDSETSKWAGHLRRIMAEIGPY
jgi:hypothetical protein